MKILISLLLPLSVLWSPLSPVQAAEPFCSFRVASPDDAILSEHSLPGKITVLFYETRDGSERSTALKLRLNSFFQDQTADIQRGVLRAGIVDASDVPKLFHPLVRSAVRSASAKEGVPLYIDFDGKMKQNCSLHSPSETTLVLIDAAGRLHKKYDAALADPASVMGEIVRLHLQK